MIPIVMLKVMNWFHALSTKLGQILQAYNRPLAIREMATLLNN